MAFRILTIYFLFAFAVLMLTPLLGTENISIYKAFITSTSTAHEILFNYRLPRTILAMLCGGGLAMAGAAFQAIFRNSLVEPYTLGISGGAAVGAYLSIAFPIFAVHFSVFGTQQLFSLVGAISVMYFAYKVAINNRGINPQTLLLGGLTISIICSGVIILLSYISDPHQLAFAQRWMLGGFDYAGYTAIISILPFLLPGLGLLLYYSPSLNLLNLGDEAAQGLGVDTKLVYVSTFIGGGLVTASVVSVAGPVAFIGLLTPHFVRRSTFVLPSSFFLVLINVLFFLPHFF